ncbi:Gp49 family protein [Serratia sp. PAMC26656]|uniref:Gp49 family protein n=1 Tax=Serratia sp. PAMC26656 TaxID=2775909 RepID=UPI0018F4351D|nr:hypothetical protein [Serratia sp. PAMC26656]
MNDKAIEQEIQVKGKTAPRVTPDHIESVIRSEVYFTVGDAIKAPGGVRIKSEYVEGERILAPLDLLTICVLVLRNGFTVTGESACASPENFDAEIGQKIARANAVQKIWMLEGYLLKQHLYQQCTDERMCENCYSGQGTCRNK